MTTDPAAGRHQDRNRRGKPLSAYLARLICLCVLPLLLLAVWLAVDSVLNTQADRDIVAQSLVKNFSTDIEHQLNARIAALNMLAISPLVDDPSRWEDLYREAQGFHRSFGSHVILADVGTPMHMLFNTRVPFGTALPLLPRPKGHAAAPVALETGQPAVGDTFFGPIAKEPLLAIAVPAMREGKPAFLLLTIFETKQFQERLDKVDLPSGWSLALCDGKGDLIAGRMPSGQKPHGEADSSGRFVVNSSLSHWSVILAIPKNVYRAPVYAAALAVGAGVLGATLMAVVGGMLAGRRLGRSVASLADATPSGARLPDIREIDAVQRLLDEAGERRKTAEDTLRESEQRYRELVQNANSAIVRWRSDGTITFFNEYAQAFFGYTAEEIVGQHVGIIVPESESTGGDLNALVRNIATNPDDCLNFVNENICRDGRRVWMAWTNKPLFDKKGALTEILAVGTDITSRKRMEEALREAKDEAQRRAGEAEERERILNAMMEHIPLGITIADAPDVTIRAVSRYGRELTGRPRERLENIPVDKHVEQWEIYHANGVTPAANEELPLTRATQQGEIVRDEEWVLGRSDGTRIPILCTAAPIRDSEGHITGGVIGWQDITERKHNEQALKESEQMYRTIGEAIPYGVWVTDAIGYCRFVSASFLEMVGMTLEEIQEFGWLHLLPAEDVEPTKEHWLHCVQTGEDFNHEHKFRSADGSFRYVLALGRPVRDAEGDIVNWVGLNLDITERKRTENALRESQTTLEAALASMTDAVFISDAEGRFVQFNEAFATFHRFGSKEECLKTLAEYPDILDVFMDTGELASVDQWAVPRALRGETVSNAEYTLKRKDTGETWVGSYSFGPILDKEGRIVGSVVVGRDVTERKRMEEALRESEQRFRLALRNAPVSVAAQDLDLRYIWAFNQRTAEPDQIVGRFDRELFTPEEAAHITAVKRRVLEENVELHEQMWLNRSGDRMFLDVTWEPIRDRDGRVTGVASATVNLTPIKLAEEALKVSLAEKEVLLKEIHHRVKNNMQVISSLVDLQADEVRDAAMRAVFQDVVHRVRSMALVHEKLYQSPDLARVQLDEYAESLLNYLWRSLPVASGIRLIPDLEPVSLSATSAVPCGLILNELVSNALKHAFGGRTEGEVSVTIRGGEHGLVRLSVRDNGRGLPEGFDWTQGRSLGLRLVQMLAGQLHASVEVSGHNGTQFTVTFTESNI